ncbi:E3 ubiquitin-protein ligase ATL6-like [Abrus precatorius]|uniref:RING-type E3 ubiquitin transferase n=1 Tax=Abrus precatorius TaxID=3816 RepID=A0A8B8M7R1_ABRPR|nr:E3 ubiquitin-protein ligase ATL6-like [Abrus precatorius]
MVDPEHFNIYPILFFTVFSLGDGKAQTAQPLPSPTLWDYSSIIVVVVAFILAFLLVAVFSIFLHRCLQSHLTERTCTCSHGNIPPEILSTFPIFSHSSLNHLRRELEETLQCAICLNDFTFHDTLRLLPHCNHVFHPPCIDAWLSSHATCPVCRANLLRPRTMLLSSDRRGG